MNAIIRSSPVFIDGLKLATVESGSFDITSGDEAQFGTDGYIGHSDGAMTSKVETSHIVPVAGMEAKIKQAVLEKRNVMATVFTDGGTFTFYGRMTSLGYNWDSKTGANKGKVTIEGGAPTLA